MTPLREEGRDQSRRDMSWAKVPEAVAYLGLDATALNVFIILSSKAGRSREAWITQRTMGEGLGVHRTTVGRAIKRLRREGLVREAGKIPVGDPPVWVTKYEVAPFNTPNDLREVRSRRTSGAHEVRLGADEVRLRRTQSSASKAVPLKQAAADERRNTEHSPNNPWCWCPDCWDPDRQEGRRGDDEPNPATDAVAPEVVSPRD